MKNIKEINKEFYRALLEDYSMLGLYYMKSDNKFIGIDNSTGDCWVEEFSNLEKCIDWLNGNEVFECYDCGEVESPTISITIEFKDGETYSDLTDLDETDDIDVYVKELVEEKGWEEDYKDYSYGYFCPYCLNSLE